MKMYLNQSSKISKSLKMESSTKKLVSSSLKKITKIRVSL